MSFNSLAYLIFLPLTILLYYLSPVKYRNYLLLALSYFFYMRWQAAYALLIFISTVLTYACGRLIGSRPRHKKLWVALSLGVNLGILFFFKYFNFAAGLAAEVAGWWGATANAPVLDVLLPVGISFYTFQALGYTIDVYRGQMEPEKDFAIYGLFVSFFPQLVAGPIERSGNLLPQFREEHSFDWANINRGMLPLLWGFFKKVVIADQLAVVVNTVYSAPDSYLPLQLAAATVAFAFQIYCDFSAYSDIARGSAAMLGFRLMRNFNAPYFSTSIQDFWRRWHISLTTWFRDYLYFPLGGSRCSAPRHYLNVLIVFLLSGLWHGASLTFIVWGLLNGVYQLISFITASWRKKLLNSLRIKEGWLLTWVRCGVTFILVCLAWVFFRADSIADACHIIGAILGLLPSGAGGEFSLIALGLKAADLKMLAVAMATLLAVDFAQLRWGLDERVNGNIWLKYLAWFLLLAFILIFGSYGAGYDPQDFVYFQF
ncbi:MAG: MBOAT family O-acyltransferase [Bacillota bacterium]|nr:MBOAT family O-acyltransferase [Bacillota bacterium]